MTMRSLISSTMMAMVLMATSGAQHVASYSNTRSDITKIKTALGHLTVIEVSEPVVAVAAGSPAFKVEWRENKVFVQPTEADLATNLFIWTASERFNYELSAAGPVAEMDFAIDQGRTVAAEMIPKPQAEPAAPRSSAAPEEMLLAARPIRLEAAKPSTNPIRVLVHDVYESNGKLFIRYEVRNHGTVAYHLGPPQVYQLDDARYPRSLYSLVNSQLGEGEASHLKIHHQVPLETVDHEVETANLGAGEETVAVVAVAAPRTEKPTVLCLEFAPDGSRRVRAFLVR